MPFHPLTFWHEAAAGGGIPSQTHWLDLETSSSQYAGITDAAQNGVLDITTDFTVEWRMKAESLTTGVTVAKWSSGSPLFRCYLFSDGRIYFETYNSSGGRNAYKTTDAVISAGTEYHVACVQNLSTGAKLVYIDGTSVALSLVAGAAATSLNSTTSPFQVGAQDGITHYDGLIADVRLWSDIRTGTEINDNKAADIDPAASNLIGLWYKSNNHSDETSNGNDLTPVNSPVFTSYP